MKDLAKFGDYGWWSKGLRDEARSFMREQGREERFVKLAKEVRELREFAGKPAPRAKKKEVHEGEYCPKRKDKIHCECWWGAF